MAGYNLVVAHNLEAKKKNENCENDDNNLHHHHRQIPPEDFLASHWPDIVFPNNKHQRIVPPSVYGTSTVYSAFTSQKNCS
jgi:hypothetical protein